MKDVDDGRDTHVPVMWCGTPWNRYEIIIHHITSQPRPAMIIIPAKLLISFAFLSPSPWLLYGSARRGDQTGELLPQSNMHFSGTALQQGTPGGRRCADRCQIQDAPWKGWKGREEIISRLQVCLCCSCLCTRIICGILWQSSLLLMRPNYTRYCDWKF